MPSRRGWLQLPLVEGGTDVTFLSGSSTVFQQQQRGTWDSGFSEPQLPGGRCIRGFPRKPPACRRRGSRVRLCLQAEEAGRGSSRLGLAVCSDGKRNVYPALKASSARVQGAGCCRVGKTSAWPASLPALLRRVLTEAEGQGQLFGSQKCAVIDGIDKAGRTGS